MGLHQDFEDITGGEIRSGCHYLIESTMKEGGRFEDIDLNG